MSFSDNRGDSVSIHYVHAQADFEPQLMSVLADSESFTQTK
jgi:hypothetical protein